MAACNQHNFYPNVTILGSGFCYRRSVCLSGVCTVTFVRPTQGVEPFSNIYSPLCEQGGSKINAVSFCEANKLHYDKKIAAEQQNIIFINLCCLF